MRARLAALGRGRVVVIAVVLANNAGGDFDGVTGVRCDLNFFLG